MPAVNTFYNIAIMPERFRLNRLLRVGEIGSVFQSHLLTCERLERRGNNPLFAAPVINPFC